MKSVAIASTRVFGLLLGVALVSISALAAVPRFAYVVNSKDATVSVYAVDAASGQLRNNGYVLTETKPSGVTIAGGAFVYVSNSGKNNVSAFTLDALTGALTAVAGSPFTAGTAPQRSFPIRPGSLFSWRMRERATSRRSRSTPRRAV